MIVPGSNLLAMALRVIGSQQVLYFADTGQVRQPNGVFLTSYAAPVTLTHGSVQSIDRRRYQALGLDWQKTYVMWYVPEQDFVAVARSKSGDVIEWNSGRYQLVGDNPWIEQDNWKSAICVLIGPATGVLNNG